MPIYRVDMILPYLSGLPRDVAINSFHVFIADPLDEGSAATIVSSFTGFYNTVLGDDAVGERIAGIVDRAANGCRITIREVGVPGAPAFEDTWTIVAPLNNVALPLEVAVCLSFGNNFPGTPRARTRGRVFIGPLANSEAVITLNSQSQPTVDDTFIFDLGLAAVALGNSLAAESITWGVYSRVDETLYAIAGGYVDNAFDTQRRREIEATSRTPWVLA